MLSLICTVAITALCAAVLLLFGRQLLGRFDAASLADYWWLLALAQLVGGLYVTLTAWAIRTRDYRGLAVARLAQAVLGSVGQVAAGVAGAGAAGLVLGDCVGRGAAGGRLSVRTHTLLLRRTREVTIDRLRRTAARYRRFPLIGSWSMLINSIGFEAPLLLVVAFYGSSAGGLFAFAQRLIGAPVALVVLAVGQVFVAEAAGRARADSSELTEFFRATLTRLALVAAPLMLCIAIGATLLVGPVFGSTWDEAGTYIVLLTRSTPCSCSRARSEASSRSSSARISPCREVVRIALLALAIGIAQVLSLSATWAVILLSAAGTLAYVLYGLISWHALQVYERRRGIVRASAGVQL